MTDERPVLASAPVDWRKAPSKSRIAHWTAMREWVSVTCHRYAIDHRTVPPCWYLHDGLVDALSALMEMYRWCYDPSAPLNRPSEFQLRLRDMEARLIELTARTGCTRDTHRPEPEYTPPTDGDRFADHVRDDIRSRADNEIRCAVRSTSTDGMSR